MPPLAYVLVGSLALAALLTIRWVPRRSDSLGRRRPFPRISVGLCVAIAIGCAVPLWTHARLEARLEGAAGKIVGEPVRVHCQTSGQAFLDVGAELGWVRWGPDGVPEHSTLIKRGPCADLSAWLRSSKRDPSSDEVVAVHVLTHEAMHMSGIKNEAHAECAAMQRDAAMAVALGASPAQGAELARRYWLETYPQMPSEYVRGCGAGSEYDEGLPNPPWADETTG
ncbi:hypothetical protein [Cellulomonas sp. HZM]|uniref:hypothetical protein n=1 Tax=Cellulomonas sp. HZM TaxID=1454010 RepID=UPI0004931FB2|nr:hypothetical protein [Cellulomonas sp. HZM]